MCLKDLKLHVIWFDGSLSKKAPGIQCLSAKYFFINVAHFITFYSVSIRKTTRVLN